MRRQVQHIGWVVVGLLAFTAQAEARPLTMRMAERAIDRGFYAELAGDYAGARDALRGLSDTSTLAEDAPGRARIATWLRGLDEREAAFSQLGKTAQGYARAYATLREFGPSREDLLWGRALRDVQGLKAAQTDHGVVLRPDLLKGVEPGDVGIDRLRQYLSQRGVKVGEGGRFEVRINLDASQVGEVAGGRRVIGETSFVLRDLQHKNEVVGSLSKSRAEVRRQTDAARRFVIRRVMDDAGHALVFCFRAQLLEDAANFDSNFKVRSN
ncbi:MAG: hypothetical protein IPG45_05440 [Deltaproteobacteria bacterium]|jgi:hypothetical protein|nr:hypothetical protein [Deltaproteobacteria bacterium]